ncbi:hypothetical protein HDU76_005411 [Blyttiomyces sp. JEL0837]|nr:hypothetical protein HDU76_005411 [Blyttiomyces sp. JEL0837]
MVNSQLFLSLSSVIAGLATIAAASPCSMLKLTNDYRQSKGLTSLKMDRRLVAAAQFHSEDMAANDFFDHDSSDGTAWYDRVNNYFPNWAYLAENVGAYTDNETLMMDLYIASPEHNANLLDVRAVYFGSGYADTYWTQDFASTLPGDIPFPVDCITEDGFSWPQPASPTQDFTGTVKTYEGLCLDSSAGKGGLVTAQLCVRGNLNQSWTLKWEGGGFFAQVTGTNLCIDVFGSSTKNGAAIGLWTCTGNINQQFMANGNGGWTMFHSGSCFDLPMGGITHQPGTKFQEWTCNGGINQILKPTPPQSGVAQPYGFTGTLTSPDLLCLDSAQGKGKSIQANTCKTGVSTQQWTLVQVGSYFAIQSTGTNLCIDVFQQSRKSGATIGLWTCNGGLNQAWSVNSNGGLTSLNSGMCMELPGAANLQHTPGMAPLQQSCTGASNQIFTPK